MKFFTLTLFVSVATLQLAEAHDVRNGNQEQRGGNTSGIRGGGHHNDMPGSRAHPADGIGGRSNDLLGEIASCMHACGPGPSGPEIPWLEMIEHMDCLAHCMEPLETRARAYKGDGIGGRNDELPSDGLLEQIASCMHACGPGPSGPEIPWLEMIEHMDCLAHCMGPLETSLETRAQKGDGIGGRSNELLGEIASCMHACGPGPSGPEIPWAEMIEHMDCLAHCMGPLESRAQKGDGHDGRSFETDNDIQKQRGGITGGMRGGGHHKREIP